MTRNFRSVIEQFFGDATGDRGSRAAEDCAILLINDPKNLTDKEFLATLAKGLAAIRAFGAERPRLTLSQAAETCSASVLDGNDIVYAARVQTSRTMTSAVAVGARLTAWRTAMGSIMLGSVDDDELRRRLRAARVEAYTPSTITDFGALLERAAQDRARGFSIVDEELEKGLRSISVSLATRRNCAIGAFDVSVHANRTTRNEMRDRFLPLRRDIAREVAQSTE